MIASTLVLIAAAISGVRGVGEEKIDPISVFGGGADFYVFWNKGRERELRA